jgi:Putative auto-transporter adhesin, head GIN domain
MKKFALLLLLLATPLAFAQKREKIKGSKNVTVKQKEVAAFNDIEVEDNIEAYLVQGSSTQIEVEADDNLHDVIMAEVKGTTLRLYTSKEISGAKKIAVRINCTPQLKKILVKHEAILYALKDLEMDSLAIKSIDYSKLYLNIKTGAYFGLNMNDKAEAELNLKTAKSAIEMSKNAKLKALISSPELKLDMYQKTTAAIEGDAKAALVRLDNMCELTAKKFTAKTMDLTTESYAKCSVMVEEQLTMSASGKTETAVFGNPEKLIITLKKFADSAILAKKEDKDK